MDAKTLSITVLERLQKVKKVGEHKWIARCPAHPDDSPSLCITQKPEGTLLIHCFAGCPIHAVLAEIGLTLEDLFPNEPENSLQRLAEAQRRKVRGLPPFDAESLLRELLMESTVILLALRDIQGGAELSRLDAIRLESAVSALESIRAKVHSQKRNR